MLGTIPRAPACTIDHEGSAHRATHGVTAFGKAGGGPHSPLRASTLYTATNPRPLTAASALGPRHGRHRPPSACWHNGCARPVNTQHQRPLLGAQVRRLRTPSSRMSQKARTKDIPPLWHRGWSSQCQDRHHLLLPRARNRHTSPCSPAPSTCPHTCADRHCDRGRPTLGLRGCRHRGCRQWEVEQRHALGGALVLGLWPLRTLLACCQSHRA